MRKRAPVRSSLLGTEPPKPQRNADGPPEPARGELGRDLGGALADEPDEPQIAQDAVDVYDMRLFALPMVRQDDDGRIGRMRAKPPDVSVELRVEAAERRARPRVTVQEEARGGVSEPVGGREEDEEVIPVLLKEQRLRQREAGFLQAAQVGDVLVEARLEGRRIVAVCSEGVRITGTPVEREDAPALVHRQPAVHDHRSVAVVLVDREVDEDRALAFASQGS